MGADGSSNQALLEKAAENLAAIAPGGKLVPEQATQFFEVATLKSKLLPRCTVRTTENPSYEEPKIQFVGEVLRPGQESTPVADNERAAATHDKVTLTPKLFKAEVRTTYEAVEDAIVRERLPQLIQSLAAERIAADIEKVVIQGDTAGSGSPLLKQLDGIIKQTTTNIVAGGGVRLNPTILTSMQRMMPEEFESEESSWVYLTNKVAAIDYWQTFGDRQTSGGDEARVGSPVGYARAGKYGLHGGVPIETIPLWPRKLTGTGGTLDHTTVMLLNPKNICVCFRRDVQIEMDRDIRRSEIFFVVRCRFDVKLIHEPAVVMATDIKRAP